MRIAESLAAVSTGAGETRTNSSIGLLLLFLLHTIRLYTNCNKNQYLFFEYTFNRMCFVVIRQQDILSHLFAIQTCGSLAIYMLLS